MLYVTGLSEGLLLVLRLLLLLLLLFTVVVVAVGVRYSTESKCHPIYQRVCLSQTGLDVSRKAILTYGGKNKLNQFGQHDLSNFVQHQKT